MREEAKPQPLIKELMTTLLERCPGLLDESDKRDLRNREFCKEDLGLKISSFALLRPVAEGPMMKGHARYYKDEYGDYYVCSQWWKQDHEHNARSLLKFVEELIERKATHPNVRELDKHRQAFDTYLRSTSRTPRAAEPSRPVGEVGEVSRPTRPARRSDHPRNRILYGPPGTGKTYSTVSHALAIVDGVKPNAEITEPDRQRFRRLRFKRAADSAPAEGRIAMVTFHQNYAYEDFVEGIRPALTTTGGDQGATSAELGYELRPGIFRTICKAATEAPDQNFVIIIDEINRGNIPKIFGELITLIEDSRRLGEDDATTVTLPYSGDAFGVPDNLYIIGTMNTADRSIQQLDTALRRRFTFVEMMPKEDHKLISTNVKEGFDELGASSNGVNCREMLRAMNERIALLLDREHQIGHTYLLKVGTAEQLADTFRNRIFPLLQEYFYDDWRKIRAVLGGNAFVNERKIGEGHAKDLAQEFDLPDDETVIYERLPLDDPAWEDASEYKAIYGNADRE